MDLREVLNQHQNFHLQIQAEQMAGEEQTEAQKENIEQAIRGQMQQIIAELGLRGVGDLVHVTQELIMESILRPPLNADPEEIEDIKWRASQLCEWVMMASLTGRF
jgi:hypothetical protein